MVLGIQNIVLDARLGQHPADQLGHLDGHRAHQHRLALFMALLDLPDDGPVLARLGLEHVVGLVLADQGLVGGDLHDVQVVDLPKLLLLGHGGARHAGQLVVQAEVVLEGDGGQGLGLPGHGDVLLGLNGLMQALVVPPAVHQPAGELVHDDDLAVLHHVVNVPPHHAPGLDGLVDMMGQGGIFRVGQVLDVELLLRLGHAPGGKGGGAGLLIHDVVRVDVAGFFLLCVHLRHLQALQPGDKVVHQLVELGRLLPLAGDDQRRAGLIDEDGVHLVHDGEGVAPLHQLAGVDGHVVPQVVKAKLVVGAVGNVGGVGRFLARLIHPVDGQPHSEAQKAVHLAHPLRVALGQVVVGGDDVHPLARQGVQVGGQGGHQSLALAGLHLSDAPLVKNDTADELHPVGAHTQYPLVRLPADSEGLGEDVVQRLALGQTLLKLVGLGPQLMIAEGFHPVSQRLNFIYQRRERLDLPLGTGAEYF